MTPQRERFRELHAGGIFVIPNPWDVGSARLLESLGFPALATTSAGQAASLGRHDQTVTLDELAAHTAELCAAVDVPVNVDFEWGYAPEPEGLAATIDRLARAGASGFSLEDFDPVAGEVVSIERAVERVAAGAAAAAEHGMLLTARTENYLHGRPDIDDTVRRLERFIEAGADAVYAPGLRDPRDIARVVALGAPVNHLAVKGSPPVPELGRLGVRRVSTGGGLARVAYGALVAAARELLGAGTTGYLDATLGADDANAAFGKR